MRKDCRQLPNGCFKTGDGRVVRPDPKGRHLLVDGTVKRVAVPKLKHYYLTRVKYMIDTNNCWSWKFCTSNGYPFLYNPKTQGMVLAHRVFYSKVFGRIKKGMTIDHLCRNHSCVNPSHLEMVTHKENIARGFSPSAINSRKTECERGHHPLSGDNLYVDKYGKRNCRICIKLNLQRYRKGKRIYRLARWVLV